MGVTPEIEDGSVRLNRPTAAEKAKRQAENAVLAEGSTTTSQLMPVDRPTPIICDGGPEAACFCIHACPVFKNEPGNCANVSGTGQVMKSLMMKLFIDEGR